MKLTLQSRTTATSESIDDDLSSQAASSPKVAAFHHSRFHCEGQTNSDTSTFDEVFRNFHIIYIVFITLPIENVIFITQTFKK